MGEIILEPQKQCKIFSFIKKMRRYKVIKAVNTGDYVFDYVVTDFNNRPLAIVVNIDKKGSSYLDGMNSKLEHAKKYYEEDVPGYFVMCVGKNDEKIYMYSKQTEDRLIEIGRLKYTDLIRFQKNRDSRNIINFESSRLKRLVFSCVSIFVGVICLNKICKWGFTEFELTLFFMSIALLMVPFVKKISAFSVSVENYEKHKDAENSKK